MRCKIGNLTSPSSIANTLTSNHLKTDPKTVSRYIRGLTDSLLFYEARRYNIKGKRLLSSSNKYYVCDVALRKISDHYPKYLLTLDELFGEVNYDGIMKRNAITWMLE